MSAILPLSFFNRPTLEVAEDLIGTFLVRRIGKKTMALRISEVEAYDGFKDKASHVNRGKTARTEVMFGEPGHFYVYFVYGMHFMLNIVTGPREYPAAILIRGAGETVGPARLTKFLNIDKKLNTLSAIPKTGLWFEDRGEEPTRVVRTARIGVAYAGPLWSRKKYRFVLSSEKISKKKRA